MISEEEYKEHPVFEQLTKYAKFYDDLSTSAMYFVSMGIASVFNIDFYVYNSMSGTLESIREILKNGRVNDSYALLRKFYDAAIINIYTSLYLDENVSIENFVVKKIENWVQGKEQLPDIREMNSYIQKSERISSIYKLLHKDKRYSELRNRCNDHTHYNFYYNVLMNDSVLLSDKAATILNRFAKDLDNIFILHLSYIFCINGHYMMASDYIDYLDCGMTPEPNSQYWVAPYIQDIFDSVIKKNRMDLALEIKGKTSMQLN